MKIALSMVVALSLCVAVPSIATQTADPRVVIAGTTCQVMEKVNGVLTGVDVPCSSLEEHPIPCVKETLLESGSLLTEEVPCKPGEQKTVEQLEREEAAAQKKACGRDYQALRIGMKLDRYEQCTESPVFVTETVTKEGSSEVYRSTFYFIHVRNGRIVGYTRR